MRHSCRCKLHVAFFVVTLYLAVFLFVLLVTLDHRVTNRAKGMAHVPGVNPLAGARGAGLPGLEPPAWAILPGPKGVLPNRMHRSLHWCKALRFQTPSSTVTALASFPGSGNTWLRYLLQQATGIHTGSVYTDYALMRNGFPHEGIANSSVLVVKTHEWGEKVRQSFQQAILLVREPRASIQAEFNRQSGGHVGYASREKYMKNAGKVWWDFVRNKSKVWKTTLLDWLQFQGPLHVVFYESLCHNPHRELEGILQFLNINYTTADVECAVGRQEGIYQRKSRNLGFNPFSGDMLRIFSDYEKEVNQSLSKLL